MRLWNWSQIFSTPLHNTSRGGSRAVATSKMVCFVIIVNGFQLLTIITKRSILDVVAALDPPLTSKHAMNLWRPGRYLFVESQQWKRQDNVWNLFKINNKDTRTSSLMSFWGLYCLIWRDFPHCFSISIIDVEQKNGSRKGFHDKFCGTSD